MAQTEVNRWRIGRFAFELPTDFALGEQRQQIYYVRLTVDPLTSENTLEDSWSQRVAEVKGLDSTDIRSFRETVVDPGMKALYYQSKDDDEVVNLAAQLPAADHALWLTAQGLVDKQDMMERLYGKIARGYVSGDQPGFWSGRGALTTKPGRTENAQITLSDEVKGLEVQIETQAVKRELKGNPLDEVDHTFDILKGFGATGRVLKNTERTLMGLTGFEGRLATKAVDLKELSFTWFYPGTPFDGLRPEISVELTGPAAHEEELEVIWNQLMESLHLARGAE